MTISLLPLSEVFQRLEGYTRMGGFNQDDRHLCKVFLGVGCNQVFFPISSISF